MAVVAFRPKAAFVHIILLVAADAAHRQHRFGCVIDDSPKQPQIEVSVRDTGVGIDPQNHELVFQKFYQTGEIMLHSSGKTKFKGGGPGLGLAIARGIVNSHGGRIWLESPGYDEVKKPGTTVFIRLPVQGQPDEKK